MSKNEENIFAEERKRLIVELVNRKIKTTVADLCEEFNVSPATVRNDLRELEFAGLLKRTHGGAISNKKTNFDLPYAERLANWQLLWWSREIKLLLILAQPPENWL